MAQYKVVMTDYEYEDISVERFLFQKANMDFCCYNYTNEDEILTVVKDADAIITQCSIISRYIIENLEHCKIIIKHGTGFDNINIKAATEKGIYVCNVPDYGIDEVSNHAIAFIMGLNRKLPIMRKTIEDGEWGYQKAVPIKRLENSILGLAGFGRIPKLIAKKMKNFNLKIIVYDPYVDPRDVEDYDITLVDFKTLCEESDIISVHTPLTEETKYLFDEKAFRNMKKTAYIINTSRGPVISNKDLLKALEEGEIAGAGMDVFEEEPLPMNNKLLQMDNVIVTPHSAWYSEEAFTLIQKMTAEEVIRVLQGKQPINLVNKEVLKQ